ncbi:MAG: hypothetical protein AB8B88_11530 [Devosiaceae bacterium]
MSRSGTAVLDPGALNIRMQALEPVAVDDGMGGQTTTPVVRRSLWAAFAADSPTRSHASPLKDALTRGQVRTRIGIAPPVGWKLTWTALGAERCVEILAVERGTQSNPFDVCAVQEVAP